MKRQFGSFILIGFVAALGVCLGAGTAAADDIAWDLVDSTDSNMVSFSTDAPVFSSPGDGFQKYQVGVSASIPYALVDDTNAGYPADTVGVIDAATDFDEFFGVVDTENDDNAGPVNATWVFDISSAVGNLQLQVDLAAMGDFELGDDTADPPIIQDEFRWTYQVDGGSVQTFLVALADEDGTYTYTMADGTTRDWDDPLLCNGEMLTNDFETFVTSIPSGSQLTVNLEVTVDGGSESYVVRNILVTDYDPTQGGGEPIPTLSGMAMAAMVLLLMAGGIFLFRRMR